MLSPSMRILQWDGAFPETGDLLKSRAGMLYRVIHVRGTRPGSKSLAVLGLLRLEADDDATVFEGQCLQHFRWCSRPESPAVPAFAAGRQPLSLLRRDRRERP